MININNMAKAYSEAYEFMQFMGNDYINKVSEHVYETIKNNRERDYKNIIEVVDGNIKYNFSKEGLALIAALNLQYWCKNQEEKEFYIKKYQKNEKREPYNSVDVFKKKVQVKEIKKETMENELAITVTYKENIFKRIINKIKNIFK